MSDAIRFDDMRVLVEEFDEVRALRLPAAADYRPLATIETPFCEPCEGCGDPTGTRPGNGLLCGEYPGPCALCWGSGRALFAWTDEPGPALPVCVPPVIASAWLAERPAQRCSPAPRAPGRWFS